MFRLAPLTINHCHYFYSLRPRMRLIVNLQHMLHRQLRVALGGRQTLVAQQLLNRPQISALLEHVRAKSMTQRVRMHIRRKPLRHGNLLDNASNAASSKPPAASVNQERGRMLSSRAKNSLAFRQIRSQSQPHRLTERDVTLFLPLAANQDSLGAKTNVVQVDSGKLRVANA